MTKIDIIIPEEIKDRIVKTLKKYGKYEIGGILIGIKRNANIFEIIDFSISNENRILSMFGFYRCISKSKKLLKKHFKKKTGYYIGEWHSHPNFSLNPSSKDIFTMYKILEDPNYGINFAILLITRLNDGLLKYKGYFFHKDLEDILILN